jgi:hypothetical protein
LVLTWDSEFRAGKEKGGNVGAGVLERVCGGATEPLIWEGLVHVERCNVLPVRKGLVCTVRKSTEDEDTLSSGNGQPADTSVELRVVVLSLVVDKNTFLSEGRVAELSVVFVGDAGETLETGKVEVGLIAEVCVFTRDGVVNFEETVLADTEGGLRGISTMFLWRSGMERGVKRGAAYTKGVWYSGVWATNGVFSRGKVTSGKQSKGRQEHASVITKTQSDLASIGSLSKGGNTSAVDFKELVCALFEDQEPRKMKHSSGSTSLQNQGSERDRDKERGWLL